MSEEVREDREVREEIDKDVSEQIIEQVRKWRTDLEILSFEEQFDYVLQLFNPQDVVLASSLSIEDQVLTHRFVQANQQARVFFLDTGRHYEQTYKTLKESREFFGIKYEVYAPPTQELEAFLNENGPNSFYDSVELRKKCCHIRKVIPLQRVLSTAKLWITGVRREHSANRQEVDLLEWDAVNGLYKFNPLVLWKLEDVEAYIKQYQLPINPLHHEGFPSIGCAPCTRKVLPGEDPRRGRWWWEDTSHNECGLHQR